MSWFKGTRARLRLLFGGRTAESRMDEEFEFHIEMETERLVRESGLNRAEARRQALVAFGGVEKYKEELREGRGLAWLAGMKLDLKLGFLLTAIFSRAFWQLGLGVLIGLVPGTYLLTAGAPEVASGGRPLIGVGGPMAVAAFMMTVGLLACAGLPNARCKSSPRTR